MFPTTFRRSLKFASILGQTICLVANLIINPVASGQTITGQTGSLFVPYADTHLPGNFTVGTYYHVSESGVIRFESFPTFLYTGIAKDVEVGFSFPGLVGAGVTGDALSGFSQIAAKWRWKGESDTDPLRVSSGVVIQRIIINDPVKEQSQLPTYGIQNVVSKNLKGYSLHGLTEFVREKSGSNPWLIRAGIAFHRPFSNQLDASIDALVSSGRFHRPSASTITLSLKYEIFPHITISGGGGLGLTNKDVDWRCIIGISLSSFLRKPVNLPNPEDIVPPSLETLILPDVLQPEQEPIVQEQVATHQVEFKPFESRLFFDFSTFVLKPNEEKNYQSLVQSLRELNHTCGLQITGHADRHGLYIRNASWGLTRAIHIAGRLLTDCQIDPYSITLASFGNRDKSDVRLSTAADQLNRRVNLFVNSPAVFKSVESELEMSWLSDTTTSSVTTELSDIEKQRISDLLQKVKPISSCDTIVIDAYSTPDQAKVALYRSALVWNHLVGTSCVPNSNVFIRMLPLNQYKQPTDSLNKSAVCELERMASENGSLLLQLNRFELPGVIQDSLELEFTLTQTSGIDTIQTGRYFVPTKEVCEYQFEIPFDIQPNDVKSLTCTIKSPGKTITVAVVNRMYETEWASRFASALELSASDLKAKNTPLSIRLYRSKRE